MGRLQLLELLYKRNTYMSFLECPSSCIKCALLSTGPERRCPVTAPHVSSLSRQRMVVKHEIDKAYIYEEDR